MKKWLLIIFLFGCETTQVATKVKVRTAEILVTMTNQQQTNAIVALQNERDELKRIIDTLRGYVVHMDTTNTYIDSTSTVRFRDSVFFRVLGANTVRVFGPPPADTIRDPRDTGLLPEPIFLKTGE